MDKGSIKKIIKMVVAGAVIWGVQYAVFLLLYPGDKPLIEMTLLNMLVMLAASLTTSLMLVLYFRSIEKNFLKEGILAGGAWLLINWLLDMVQLQSSNIDPVTYFTQIGFQYLTIPVMGASVGYLLKIKAVEKKQPEKKEEPQILDLLRK